jgi:hypothetical protein
MILFHTLSSAARNTGKSDCIYNIGFLLRTFDSSCKMSLELVFFDLASLPVTAAIPGMPELLLELSSVGDGIPVEAPRTKRFAAP